MFTTICYNLTTFNNLKIKILIYFCYFKLFVTPVKLNYTYMSKLYF